MSAKETNKNNYFFAESVELVNSGNNYFDILETIINASKEEIHLQTYIFDEDATGTAIANALMQAAGKGVMVFVLVDAYGSKSLSYPFIRKMQEHGINFRFFSPIFSKESIYLGRRLHHKIIVIDKKIALVGGINIADKYHGTDVGPAWLDYAVLVKGEACRELSKLCEIFFEKRSIKKISEKINDPLEYSGTKLIRFSRNDWIIRKNEIYNSYRYSLINANESALFIASYFLPGYKFRKYMKEARNRGVEIKIILAGKSDLPFFWYAEKYLYDFYLRHGIEIYEWRNSVMHGKALIVDNEWTTIGSYNHNSLSHYRSIELNVEIKNAAFSEQFTKQIDQVIEISCNKIEKRNNFHSANFVLRIRNYLSYSIYRMIMKIMIPVPVKISSDE